MMRRPQGAAAEGFSLIEALIALTLVSLTLLLGLAAVSQHRTAVRILDARSNALEATEAVLESLRAGAVQVQTGPVRWLGPPPPLTVDPDLKLQLALRVRDLGPPGLREVTVITRFEVLGETRILQHPTAVWHAP